jgi:hypothetical protein
MLLWGIVVGPGVFAGCFCGMLLLGVIKRKKKKKKAYTRPPRI